MKFDPYKHHRHSIRLKGYDYTQAGGYYVTIVAQGRECFFGAIRNGEMELNDVGQMVVKWWDELPHKFPSVTADMFVVMPNHFHGILVIHETVGADLRVCPDSGAHTGEHMGAHMGEHTGAHMGAHTGAHIGSPLPRPNAPLSQIIQWFKTMTTNEYIRGVKQFGWSPFEGKLWQRNYYEHIIRGQADYERIANYIAANPAKWDEDSENPLRMRP